MFKLAQEWWSEDICERGMSMRGKGYGFFKKVI